MTTSDCKHLLVAGLLLALATPGLPGGASPFPAEAAAQPAPAQIKPPDPPPLRVGPGGRRQAVYRCTSLDLYLTARFAEKEVEVECARADGKGRRTFRGPLETGSRPDGGMSLFGTAAYRGVEAEGQVSYSFDADGLWVVTVWEPQKRSPQYLRWTPIRAVGSGTRPTAEDLRREGKP